jgi:hypothetical protein
MITQILYTELTYLVLINNIHSKTNNYSPVLSAPRGIIISAYFFVYNQNKIKLELEKSQWKQWGKWGNICRAYMLHTCSPSI